MTSVPKQLEEYEEKDFALPDEVLPDGRLTYHEQCVLLAHKQRIKRAVKDVKESTRLTKTIDSLYRDSIVSLATEKEERLLRNGASTNTLGRRGRGQITKDQAAKEHAAEMSLIRAVIGKDPCSAQQISQMTPEDFGEVSTLDYPRLNSLEEAQEDIRLDGLDHYYQTHSSRAAVKW
jgi:hypothetical protein